jgi:hypothetical protein
MEFKNWLQKIEEAKFRPKNIDIGNLAIGRIGPMGTFGQTDSPSLASRAASGLLSGIGKSLRQELGSLGADAPYNLLPPVEWKETFIDGISLPLQLPYIGGKEVPGIKVSKSASYGSDRTTLINVMNFFQGNNPLQDPRVRKTNELSKDDNKFDLANLENELNVFVAKKFTLSLAKLVMMHKNYDKTRYYDFENPKVTQYIKNNQLVCVFTYQKIKNLPSDVDQNDYTGTEDPREKEEVK